MVGERSTVAPPCTANPPPNRGERNDAETEAGSDAHHPENAGPASARCEPRRAGWSLGYLACKAPGAEVGHYVLCSSMRNQNVFRFTISASSCNRQGVIDRRGVADIMGRGIPYPGWSRSQRRTTHHSRLPRAGRLWAATSPPSTGG